MSDHGVKPFPMRRVERHARILRVAAAVEETSALNADAVGFQAWVFTQVNLPHRDPGHRDLWVRRNGRVYLTLQAGAGQLRPAEPPRILGHPSGTIPRLALAHIVSEAVRHGTARVELPETQADMLRLLFRGVSDPTAGVRYRRLREQLLRLAVARLYVSSADAGTAHRERDYPLTEDRSLWWDPAVPDQPTLWRSQVTLSAPFFDLVMRDPVPIDLRTLASLSGSSLALDLYTWLTWRLPKLEEPTLLRWASVHEQFGAEYDRVRDFRARVVKPLREVLHAYTGARVEVSAEGLILRPSPPHVARRYLSA